MTLQTEQPTEGQRNEGLSESTFRQTYIDLQRAVIREPEAPRQLKLAYLTSEYPKASHTFIRREILELEANGHDITRISIRSGSAVVDPLDLEERERTLYVLAQSWFALLWSVVRTVACRPLRFVQASKQAWQAFRASDRGVVRHAAYLVEACFLLWELKARDVEHVHVHFGKNAADVARLITALGGPGYSMTIHGPGEFDGPRTFSLGEKVEDSRFTAAISHYGTGQLRRWTQEAAWDKLNVIRCTITDDFLDAYTPQIRDTNQFVCIGRLTAQKGQLLLVDAVARLLLRGHDISLVLAGDGEMREAIEKRIQQHGIQKYIHITGWIGEAEVRQHLLDSRAMVLPSFAEGLPVAIMEALALGRPVISSCITGIPELVEEGENGWLVTSGSVDSLVDAMADCLEAPVARLNEMGWNGHQRVRRQHHSRTEARKLEQLLLRAVADGDTDSHP